MSSAICFDLDHSKILSSGNGLNHVILVISILQRETTLTTSDLTDETISMEFEIMRLVSLSTTGISEITQLKVQS